VNPAIENLESVGIVDERHRYQYGKANQHEFLTERTGGSGLQAQVRRDDQWKMAAIIMAKAWTKMPSAANNGR
jgi:hypothetical protein